jgi:hypothetical protein
MFWTLTLVLQPVRVHGRRPRRRGLGVQLLLLLLLLYLLLWPLMARLGLVGCLRLHCRLGGRQKYI